VLNDHRKRPEDRFVVQDKHDLLALFGDAVPAQDHVWRINPSAFNRPSAYAGIIDTAKSPMVDASAEEQQG